MLARVLIPISFFVVLLPLRVRQSISKGAFAERSWHEMNWMLMARVPASRVRQLKDAWMQVHPVMTRYWY